MGLPTVATRTILRRPSKPEYVLPPIKPGLYITLFADASYCPNTKAYGTSWWVKWGDPAETRMGGEGGAYIESSLEAEVAALRHGCIWIAENLMPEDLKGKRVVVQSDCTGALARILPELQLLRSLGAAQAYTKHVKGHQGHVTPRNSVNTTCDQLARRRMRKFRESNLKHKEKANG